MRVRGLTLHRPLPRVIVPGLELVLDSGRVAQVLSGLFSACYPIIR